MAVGQCLFLVVFVLLTGCTSVQKKQVKRVETVAERVSKLHRTSKQLNGDIFFLEFDVNGRFSNPTELFRLSDFIGDSLKTSQPVTNILITSYGWSYNRSKDEETYAAFVQDYVTTLYGTNGSLPGKWAVICVAWESDHSGFATLSKEWVPGNFFTDKIARPLDYAAFPLSVWSKAALADRIGYGELKECMNYVYGETYLKSETRPSIYLVGHSFGTRVLSGLVKSNRGEFWTRSLKTFLRKVRHDEEPEFGYDELVKQTAAPFVDDVQGAFFIQPALTEFDLPAEHDRAHYPIIVTQTRHDHLNGAMFPISSVPFNASLSSGYEQAALYLNQTNGVESRVAREAHDIFRIPYTLTVSGAMFPFTYLWAQVRELKDRGPLYVLDTMAQLPGAEILVRPFGVKGHRKGAFTFGPLHESAGRWATEKTAGTLQDFAREDRPRVYTNSITYLQSDATIKHGILDKENLENELIDFTAGWLDPIGSHSTYDYAGKDSTGKKAVYEAIQKLLSGSVTRVANPNPKRGLQRRFWDAVHPPKEPPAQQQQVAPLE